MGKATRKNRMSSSHLLASRLFSVKGLVALVSGGGTGIGLMVTQALAANGAKVYIVGRRKEALDRVVSVYSPNVDGQIIALPGDVTDKSDIKRLAEEIKQPRAAFTSCSTTPVFRERSPGLRKTSRRPRSSARSSSPSRRLTGGPRSSRPTFPASST